MTNKQIIIGIILCLVMLIPQVLCVLTIINEQIKYNNKFGVSHDQKG
jgi:hypothetical protein